MAGQLIDIIIPTWNNEEYLNPCVMSILATGVVPDFARIIIVNNGKQPIERKFSGVEGVWIVNSKENLGWEGGLKLGLEHSDAPFVVFQNDDTFIPYSSCKMYQNMLAFFNHPSVGAVGPVTTCAAGPQSIFHPYTPHVPVEVSFLIFFCVMVRRSALDEVGGIDDTLPGGDDFDLSIRLRQKGYGLFITPNAFMIHHGFKTGTRINGDASKAGGWNSQDMTDRTNKALIQKHGFKTWHNTLMGLKLDWEGAKPKEEEDDVIRSMVNGEVNIAELGCGGKKLFNKSIGVDRIPFGKTCPGMAGAKSVADVISDVSVSVPLEDNSQDLVVAQHILEHCVDTLETLGEWKRILKPGGKIILAVPNQEKVSSIPLNPEHVHAFTPASLDKIMKAMGFEKVTTKDVDNYVSFVGCYRKKV